MTQLQQFLKHSFSQPDIVPLVAILGFALSGAGFMGFHQAHAPDVVWSHKRNAEPWQQVRDGDQVKLAAFNQKYERKFTRKEW